MSSEASLCQRVCIRILCSVYYLKLWYYALLYAILVASALALMVYVYATGKGQPLSEVMWLFIAFVGFALLVVLFSVLCEICSHLRGHGLSNYEASLSRYGKLEEAEEKIFVVLV